uniref:Ribosome-binding factor A n=1 Tax=Globisporangium ultimum (strain ATCC 200006 / CBS 805.95 / DAOM BR144) TaxID=431595 RepID=K3WJW9_GLOUD
MLHTSGRVLRRALQRALAASTQQQQQRTFHASARRSGPSSSSATASTAKKTQAVFGADDDGNDDEADQKEIEAWFNQMQQESKKGSRFTAEDDHMDLEDDDDDDDDDDDVNDKETEEFLSEVDDLFTLEPEEFERRMQTYDKRQANTARRTTAVFGEDTDEDVDEDAAGQYEDENNEDEHEIDRATERIPKKKLLKVLDEFQPSGARIGKNAESISLPKTKNSAPLEKKPKKVNVDRVSYRQDRVELSVTNFVQSLLLQDSDSNATNVVANIVEASVAPDLRRVVLFWEPQRLNSENQTISKRKVVGIEKRLQSQERWIRMQVTRHLNLKYSPNVQFKQRRSAKSDEARAAFDREMDWLNRF